MASNRFQESALFLSRHLPVNLRGNRAGTSRRFHARPGPGHGKCLNVLALQAPALITRITAGHEHAGASRGRTATGPEKQLPWQKKKHADTATEQHTEHREHEGPNMRPTIQRSHEYTQNYFTIFIS